MVLAALEGERAQTHGAPRLAIVAGAAIVVASVLNTVGVFSEVAIHWTNWLVSFAIVAVAAVIVFGWFVRRAIRRPATAWRAGLVFSVLGLLTVVAFWSGLPPIFAAAGMYLGFTSYRDSTTRTARRAGIGVLTLGAVALALDVVFYASDVATRL